VQVYTDTAGSGGGTIEWTYEVTDSVSGLPINDVLVQLRHPDSGAVRFQATTNALGIATFLLQAADMGTYTAVSIPGGNYEGASEEVTISAE
jgi:hypothetical protein